MAFFFGSKKQHGASELVRLAASNVRELVEQPSSPVKQADAVKSLAAIKEMIAGTVDTVPDPQKVAELVNSMIRDDFFYILARSFPYLPGGPVRKDAQSILNHALRFRPADRASEEAPALSHIIDDRPEVIIELCRGYEVQECATSCGAVLKEVVKNQDATAIIFYDQHGPGEHAIRIDKVDAKVKQSGEGIFWRFFEYVKEGKFEVSTDAFNTFRDILTKHKDLTAPYLIMNFDLFFHRYHTNFVKSESYVTIRQSIKLLGELLLDRANYPVMTRYVEDREHLKLFMLLMRDTRQMIKYEAFHVFKVFVANPKKSEGVTKMLIQNRNQLLRFLPTFLSEKDDNDEQFRDEKAFLIKQINNLPSVYTPPQVETSGVDSNTELRSYDPSRSIHT